MTVPGIGPIISSAMVAGDRQRRVIRQRARFFGLIGLVPKQMSTETEPSSGASPNGATVTCAHFFMQAARVILQLRRAAAGRSTGFGIWLAHAAQRLHPNVLAAALANKLARIAWTVLAQQRGYGSAHH